MSGWTTVFLVYSLKQREQLEIHQGLKFLGDIFLAQGDERRAINLFTVALEGFTYMDVHRSRAECLLLLGDIFKGHGNLLKAVELWETAKLLFERSSQAKQVKYIQEKLAEVGEDVLQQHKNNLAHLVELNAPSGIVDELEDNIPEIDDLEVDLDEATMPGLVVI
jgi:tetratricopeptide (TPR) repeat protein